MFLICTGMEEDRRYQEEGKGYCFCETKKCRINIIKITISIRKGRIIEIASYQNRAIKAIN